MKKLLIYFLGFLMIFFIIPAICTVTPKKESVKETISVTTQEEQQTTENTQNATVYCSLNAFNFI